MIPLPAVPEPVPALIDWKIRFAAPIPVLSTSSAVPVVVAIVLPEALALTVPPPVAVNAALTPVDSWIWPLKLMVAPVLDVRLMPEPVPPVSVMAPESAMVPPFLPLMLTARPVPVLVMMPG